MFDEVLKDDRSRRRARRGASLVASAGLQVLVLAGLWLLAAATVAPPVPSRPRSVDVRFVKGAPRPASPPPAPPPPRPAPPRQAPPPAPAPAARSMVQPRAIQDELPPPGPVDPPPPEPLAAAGPGVIGGSVAAQQEVTLPPQRLDFDPATMTKPAFLSGPDPAYTRAAIAQEVEGLMVVACVITRDGRVRDCAVRQGLPHLDEAVVQALERRRYRPATLRGEPLEVNYQFRLHLRLPR